MGEKAQYHSIFLVTGRVQGGKTSYLTELAELVKDKGSKVGGFLSPGSFESGKRSGFRLKNLLTGSELPMAAVRETPGWVRYRRFWFNPDAFRTGREWISASLAEKVDLLMIDEVGPMELEGSGWYESLNFLRQLSLPIQVWSVRESLVTELMEQWDPAIAGLIHIEKTDPAQAAERIFEKMKTIRATKQTK